MFKEIYFPTQNYNRSKLDIFTHLIKVYGGGSRYLFRISDPDGSKDFLAKIFGWYCALAIRLNVDIEDCVWRKYPGVCSRCLKSVCECEKGALKEIDTYQLAQLAEKNKRSKPETLRQWQVMFGNIYRNPAKMAPRDRLAIVFSRMAEELGEVAETLLLDDVIDNDVRQVIENEMADLCAWIFALANSLHLVDPSMEGTTLADVSWNLYGGKCHRCRKAPCTCVTGSFGLELAGRGAMGPAHWDELTGLANAEGMKVKFSELDKLFKQDPQLDRSVIMFDLDNFGQVNKLYGNYAGDDVLKTAASRMLGVLDDGAIAFRRGGEEFVITLGVNLEEAQIQAEKIRQALASEPIRFNSANGNVIDLVVTASFGVANTRSDGKKPSDIDDLADQRMREAKQAGKNRVRPELGQETTHRMLTKGLYE